ncbi:MAG: tetratricopeptide repeat protein [Planctomycetaceae bacterium]|nr:tetratricopeptide repeat protein [Planctomycetaceae bacterium]
MPARRSRYLPWVLIAMAAAIGALAVYVGRGKDPTPVKSAPAGNLADDVLGKARGLMRPGGYAGARDLMIAYVRANPDDTQVRPLLAESQLALGQTAAADKILDELLARAPRDAGGLWLRGQILLKANEPAKAMEYFRKAADEGGGPGAGAEIWARFGEHLLAAGQREAAGGYLARAYDGGVKDGRTLAGLGELALEKKDYPKAADYLAQASSLSPDDAAVSIRLATAQFGAGRTDDCAITLTQALRHRRSGELLMLMGQVRQRQERQQEAGEAYAEATHFAQLAGQASAAAARCFYDAGRYAQAMKYIDMAVALQPADEALKRLKSSIESARFGPASAPGT